MTVVALLALAGCAQPGPTNEGPSASAELDAAAWVEFLPRRLVGVEPQVVERWFGPPELRRRESAAEVWSYRAGPCWLTLFLFPLPSGQVAVAHAEWRRDGTPVDGRACLPPPALRRDLERGDTADVLTLAPGTKVLQRPGA
ncbi:MAG: hypothetical protein SF002_19170 [Alphaproteobacteria bacterium]|nr:hypothetical protein [Alphaproteobacteria bacterium]